MRTATGMSRPPRRFIRAEGFTDISSGTHWMARYQDHSGHALFRVMLGAGSQRSGIYTSHIGHRRSVGRRSPGVDSRSCVDSMRCKRTPAGLEVWAPAKLNLFLEVLGKRADGFHELETLMCPIRLYDTLWIQDEPSGEDLLTLDSTAVDARGDRPAAIEESLPVGTNNLVLRAVAALRVATGTERQVRIHLIKRIPLAAGLAGGSSDAAATLWGVNQLWGSPLETAQLAELAAGLGSDVPFFLQRGTAICRGRGERIEQVPEVPRLDFVVVRPPAGLSTAKVFGACQAAEHPREVGPLVAAWQQGRVTEVGRLLANRLQPAAESLSPWISRLAGEFAELDLVGHQMSGSGTSYFGICRNRRHAQRVAARLRSRGMGQVYGVSLDC